MAKTPRLGQVMVASTKSLRQHRNDMGPRQHSCRGPLARGRSWWEFIKMFEACAVDHEDYIAMGFFGGTPCKRNTVSRLIPEGRAIDLMQG